MPTRKEIAEWLREAESDTRRAARSYGNANWFTHEKASDEKADMFADRSAKVASMRCETCKHYVHRVGGINDFCLKINEVDDMGPDFGCFAHEPKPAD